MTDKLHVTDKELRELLHPLSHDLRNPLAAIVTNLEFARRLVTREDVDPDLVESIEDSVTACDVLRRIVSNFDLLVKGHDVVVTLSEVDVGVTVRDVIRRCEARAAQADMTFALEGDTHDLRTMVDKSLLLLALENLLANSMQHGPRGATITVTLAKSEDDITVAVSDGGPAIPESARELAVAVEGHTGTGRRDTTRYGRGLGLLAAVAAAVATDAELKIGGDANGSLMSLRLKRFKV